MSVKISELPQSTDLFEGCCFPVVTNEETKKVTFGMLLEKIQQLIHIEFEETDPTVPDFVKNITRAQMEKWDESSGDMRKEVYDSVYVSGVLMHPVAEAGGIVAYISGLQFTNKAYVDYADANLQTQIDAITAQSDVVDVVGTYAELEAYSKPLYVDDIVKVLADETHNNARSYYRWESTETWDYIGSEALSYTKAEADVLLNAKASTTYVDTAISNAIGAAIAGGY